MEVYSRFWGGNSKSFLPVVHPFSDVKFRAFEIIKGIGGGESEVLRLEDLLNANLDWYPKFISCIDLEGEPPRRTRKPPCEWGGVLEGRKSSITAVSSGVSDRRSNRLWTVEYYESSMISHLL